MKAGWWIELNRPCSVFCLPLPPSFCMTYIICFPVLSVVAELGPIIVADLLVFLRVSE